MPPHQPVPTIATTICFIGFLLRTALLSPDLEQTGSVAPHYPFLLGRGKARHAIDQADRVFLAHVEGVVGAEQHLRRAELVDQVAQHLGIERDRVEKELLEIARRRLLDHRAAIGPRPPGVIHAGPVVPREPPAWGSTVFKPGSPSIPPPNNKWLP